MELSEAGIFFGVCVCLYCVCFVVVGYYVLVEYMITYLNTKVKGLCGVIERVVLGVVVAVLHALSLFSNESFLLCVGKMSAAYVLTYIRTDSGWATQKDSVLENA
jgi:uncharacterized membrane protein